MSRPITAGIGKKNNVRVAKDTFHQLCGEIKHFFIDVGVEDSHEQDAINDRGLGDQHIPLYERSEEG